MCFEDNVTSYWNTRVLYISFIICPQSCNLSIETSPTSEVLYIPFFVLKLGNLVPLVLSSTNVTDIHQLF